MKGILIILILVLAVSLIGALAQDELSSPTPVPQIFGLTRSEPTAAVTIEVDREDDPLDLLPCTEAANDCTLRSAINKANNDQVANNITFASHYLITLSQSLPVLTANGTVIRARPEQEIHINGNSIPQSVLYITGANITVDGLRVYGAGTGYSNISLGGAAYNVTIANNIIGDGDAPSGNCDLGNQTYGGIYVGGTEEIPTNARVWIYGNIIECHRGGPGDGITIATDKVVIGQDSTGQSGPAQRNTLRWNRGNGVNVGDQRGNVICNNLMHNNEAGNLFMTNFDNNFMNNEMQ